MQSPEDTRIIGKCKWCGCPLKAEYFMSRRERIFWEKGYPDCEHDDPDYHGEAEENDENQNQGLWENENSRMLGSRLSKTSMLAPA